jgi:polar amino acid transport system substrate-binding protein
MRLVTLCWFILVNALPGAGLLYASPSPLVEQLAATDHEPVVEQLFPVLEEAYKSIGIEVTLASLPGERSVQMVNAGNFDGDVIHSAGMEKLYPNLVMVPVPLLTVEASVFTDGRVLPFSDWASLQNYRICIRRGIKAIEIAATGIKSVYVVDDYRSIFEMLKAGHCDVAVLPRDAWLETQRLHISGLRELDPSLQKWPLFHYVGKSHTDIVPVLSNALSQMQKSGELEVSLQ